MSDDQQGKHDESVILTESPPTKIGGILMRLGPGLIVAGSIVGSGELIATTTTGAQAGFWLLWLILIGCVIKVFVQVELGRYTVTVGKTTMDGLAEIPGPRVAGRGNWLVWYWFLMFAASLAQLGGIVGGVGQALAISAPITAEGRNYNAYAGLETQQIVVLSELRLLRRQPSSESVSQKIAELEQEAFQLERSSNEHLLRIKQAGGEVNLGDQSDGSGTEQVNYLRALEELLSGIEPSDQESVSLVSMASDAARVESKLRQANRQAEQRPNDQRLQQNVEELTEQSAELETAVAERESEAGIEVLSTLNNAKSVPRPSAPIDDKLWASMITAITVVILVVGRYGLIQSFATAMVASFTLITIVNLFMLQSSPSWGVSVQNIIDGMSFRLPPGNTSQALGTALATFGIIGVGGSELVTYPYWCLEKGYARFTGPHELTEQWADRARGWMRVMRWDAWCSMFVYTFATLAFYLLGAAVLNRTGLDPKGTEMIRYLSVMYKPVFGEIAQIMFLFGAFAVLYSTFFVANASQARVLSDVLRVLSFAKTGSDAYRRRVRLFSGLLPLVCLSFYWSGWDPQQLVLISGVMQAMMLPMLAAAALYFRYHRCDDRIAPGRVWDLFLWMSAGGMLVAGVGAAWTKVIAPLVGL